LSKASLILHYESLNAFKKNYFKNLLTTEHLVDDERYFKKVKDEEGEDYELNKYCFILIKDNTKYLLPSEYKKHLPLVAVHKMKVAVNDTAYYFLKKVKPAAFTSYRAMSFRNLIDKLSTFNHSNNQHYKLLWLMIITQMIDKANFRVATNPGFGKDSVVQIANSLFGNAISVVSPTIAKLEFLTFAKLLAVNEVNDIKADQWRDIQQFLLDVGDMKSETAKRSRATNGVSEILDLSELSLMLYYNDITDYPNAEDKYLDFVTKKAVLDRFPALRLYGEMTEDFNKIKDVDVKELVDNSRKDYESLIRSVTFYKNNFMKELHGWKCKSEFSKLSERGKLSIGKLLRFVDLY